MTGVLERLRERFQAREEEQQAEEISTYRELVRMVADGEEPDDATVDRVLSSHVATAAQCPNDPRHANLRQYTADSGATRVICDDCGASFSHQGPLQGGPSPDGHKTLADLESDVDLLRHRRKLAALLDQRPQALAELADARRQIDEANERARRARQEALELRERLAPERLQARLAEIDRAETELLRGCNHPEVIARDREIDARRERIGPRVRELEYRNLAGTFTDASRDELKRLRSELDELRREQEALKPQKLIP